MQQALGVDDGLFIDVDNRGEVKHCGLGSSGSLISGVAATVNELYGKPLCGQELVKYLAQNHGEEVEGDDKLVQQVQCIGGSAASGLVAGGLFVIAGESQVIKTMKVPKHYKVVIGIPRDFIPQDAELMMEKEEKNLEKFVKTGERYGSQIAYRMLHEVLPAMNEQVLKPIGDLIFDYRFNMGSIENCAFVYPGIVDIAKEVQDLKENGVCEVLALSSVGPGFFGITRSPEKVKKAFEASGMQVIETEIENRKYQVVRRKQC
jgi:predicted sugar kinase